MNDDVSLNFVQLDPTRAVIVERIQEGGAPDYQIRGRTRCVECDQWCFLGSETLKVVIDGRASPVCTVCAKELAGRAHRLGIVKDQR